MPVSISRVGFSHDGSPLLQQLGLLDQLGHGKQNRGLRPEDPPVKTERTQKKKKKKQLHFESVTEEVHHRCYELPDGTTRHAKI